MTTTSTWWVEPRDPLVFGSGARSPALAPRGGSWLPSQPTMAGAVRSALIPQGLRVGRDEALDLLRIGIAGPLLAYRHEDGDPEIWVPMPADLSYVEGDGDGEGRLLRGSLLAPRPGEGVLGVGPEAPPLLLHVPAKHKGRKAESPDLAFWPLGEAVRWALRSDEPMAWTPPKESKRPLRREHRVHVKIERGPYTAEPEALFSTPGVRFARGFGLLVEVRDGRHAANATAGIPASGRLLTVGGEGRTSVLTVLARTSVPPFGDFEEAYRERARAIEAAGHRPGLRLQLLTAGCFGTPTEPGDWRPPWPQELQGKLLAAATHRFEPVSGWDLQNRRPRAVRRLVPPGAVYVLGPFDSADAVVELCRAHWMKSIAPREPMDRDRFLAAPANDGYGLVLPSPYALPHEALEALQEN